MSTPEEVGVEGLSAVLAATIDDQATSFTVEDGDGTAGMPTAAFQVLIDNEIILVGARSGNVFSGLTRAQEGSAAHSHPAGAGVRYVVGGEKIAAGGGGGSQPVKVEALIGADTAPVDPGVPTQLAFGLHSSGDNLLDLTDPLNPVLAEAGTYAISVTVSSGPPLPAGKKLSVVLTVFDDGDGYAEFYNSDIGTGASGVSSAATIPYKFAAGAIVNVVVIQTADDALYLGINECYVTKLG